MLFSQDKLPRVQLLDHVVAVCLVLQDIAGLLTGQLWVLHSHQQRTAHPVFLRLHRRWVRHCNYFSLSVVISHGSFNLHSLMSDDIEYVFLLFNCFVCASFSMKYLFMYFYQFLVTFLMSEFEYFCVDSSPLSDMWLQIFSPFHSLSFHPLNGIFCRTKVLILMQSTV